MKRGRKSKLYLKRCAALKKARAVRSRLAKERRLAGIGATQHAYFNIRGTRYQITLQEAV